RTPDSQARGGGAAKVRFNNGASFENCCSVECQSAGDVIGRVALEYIICEAAGGEHGIVYRKASPSVASLCELGQADRFQGLACKLRLRAGQSGKTCKQFPARPGSDCAAQTGRFAFRLRLSFRKPIDLVGAAREGGCFWKPRQLG